jgi:hypothetical protein
MKRLLLGVVVALALASPVDAQTFDCPAGQPASLSPGPTFVPTYDCLGWVPANHPIAKAPVAGAPTPTAPLPAPSVVTQDIATGIDFPRSGGVYSSVTSLSGWALDCTLGSYPPVIRIVETKPDGSLREIPTTNFYHATIPRPDVQAAYGGACPAVYNGRGSDGGNLGPNDRFGWSLPVSAITERGVHTFTVTFAWPAQNHAGSAAVSITIQ